MKIAICDDNIIELQNSRGVVEDFVNSTQYTQPISIHTFINANDLLFHIEKYGGFDVLLLDILMPGMNGIELATEIRYKNGECKIIFLTSSPEFAVSSYKVDAYYYLLKPLIAGELMNVLQKIACQMKEEMSTSIVIKSNGKLTRIQIHTIRFVESIRHTMHFHLNDNEVLTCYGTLSEFSDILLSEKCFIRCHKSFIINVNYVKSISATDFMMSDKTQIPISRQSYQQIKNAYLDFFFNEGAELL